MAGKRDGRARNRFETAVNRRFFDRSDSPDNKRNDRMAKVRTKINASMGGIISCCHGNFVGCEPGGGKHG